MPCPTITIEEEWPIGLLIRKECENDYRQVEELTREAFWNLHVPGCDEHYLVHVMRSHSDFIPELDFVAIAIKDIKDNEIIGLEKLPKIYVGMPLIETAEYMEIPFVELISKLNISREPEVLL